MKQFFCSFTFGLAMLSSFSVQATPAVDVHALAQSDASWDGVPYVSYPDGPPELTVLKIVIPPNTVLPWHKHPMPNAGYVASGQLTVEKSDGQRTTVSQGQVIAETVDSIHRGFTGDSPVTLIVFYAGKRGLPLSEKE